MIKPETIDQVKALSIYDVVNKYNDITLKKSGTHAWKGKSPWVNENTPSFYVVASKNIYKDFSSGKGGGPINFVMEKEGVDYIDAIKILCEAHNIQIQYDKNAPKVDDNKVEIRHALEWAAAHFLANDIPESFTKYRAFEEEALLPFEVGYAKPSWDDLLSSATKANIPVDILVKAGLVRKRESGDGYYDYFRDRIMFPIHDFRGNVIAFSGRDAETQPVKEGQDKPMKYMNSPDTCYNKSEHLYGLYQAIKGGRLKEHGAYLVEGQTDVVRMHKHGLTNTVAPCGSALTEQQAKLLKRFTDKIIYVPDNDCDKEKNAGIEAMERNVPTAIKAGFSVKVLIPGIGV